ncbi:MAG: hypothetical protein AB1560_13440 [Pseudomonadota bacterium]
MKPTVGRIVIYKQPAHEAPINGSREHPAIITRVWQTDSEESSVNLQVFFDAGTPEPRTSVLPASRGDDQCGNWDWPKRD